MYYFCEVLDLIRNTLQLVPLLPYIVTEVTGSSMLPRVQNDTHKHNFKQECTINETFCTLVTLSCNCFFSTVCFFWTLAFIVFREKRGELLYCSNLPKEIIYAKLTVLPLLLLILSCLPSLVAKRLVISDM